jgi:hypothetical protein
VRRVRFEELLQRAGTRPSSMLQAKDRSIMYSAFAVSSVAWKVPRARGLKSEARLSGQSFCFLFSRSELAKFGTAREYEIDVMALRLMMDQSDLVYRDLGTFHVSATFAKVAIEEALDECQRH